MANNLTLSNITQIITDLNHLNHDADKLQLLIYQKFIDLNSELLALPETVRSNFILKISENLLTFEYNNQRVDNLVNNTH